MTADTRRHNRMVDRLTDETLMDIFSWVGYGAGYGELTCPVARIASVSRRWNYLYRQMKQHNNIFVTYPLERLFDWTLRMDEETARTWMGAGDIESVVDAASRRTLPHWQATHANEPQWWTSFGTFTGPDWEDWCALPADSRQLGPYYLLDPENPPTIEVCFAAPTIVRAIAIDGRNLPRLIRVGADDGGQSGEDFEIRFLPCRQPLEVTIQSDEYMELVAAHLPQGSAASPDILEQRKGLPTAFPKPVLCQEKLRLHLLQSEEPEWVGMNVLGVFGEPAQG